MLTFIKTLPLTFYSADFYRLLAAKGKGIGLSYICVSIFIMIAAFAQPVISGLEQVDEEQKALLNALPEMSLNKGILSIQGEPKQEFSVLKDSEKGPFSIIFDMDSPVPPSQELITKMRNEKIFVWINKEDVFLYNPEESKLSRQNLGTEKDAVITHDDWIKASESLSTLLYSSAILGGTCILFFVHLIYAFFGGVFLLMAAPLFKRKLDLSAGVRLAAAAKVPVAVIGAFTTAFPYIQLIFWIGFALFGLLAQKQVETEKGSL